VYARSNAYFIAYFSTMDVQQDGVPELASFWKMLPSPERPQSPLDAVALMAIIKHKSKAIGTS
jgi:hypothetical protein